MSSDQYVNQLRGTCQDGSSPPETILREMYDRVTRLEWTVEERAHMRVVREGWVSKASRRRLNPQDRRYWTVLSSRGLYFYDRQEDSYPSFYIPLNGMCALTTPSRHGFELRPLQGSARADEKGQPVVRMVKLREAPDGSIMKEKSKHESFAFNVSDEQDALMWVLRIRDFTLEGEPASETQVPKPPLRRASSFSRSKTASNAEAVRRSTVSIPATVPNEREVTYRRFSTVASRVKYDSREALKAIERKYEGVEQRRHGVGVAHSLQDASPSTVNGNSTESTLSRFRSNVKVAAIEKEEAEIKLKECQELASLREAEAVAAAADASEARSIAISEIEARNQIRKNEMMKFAVQWISDRDLNLPEETQSVLARHIEHIVLSEEHADDFASLQELLEIAHATQMSRLESVESELSEEELAKIEEQVMNKDKSVEHFFVLHITDFPSPPSLSSDPAEGVMPDNVSSADAMANEKRSQAKMAAEAVVQAEMKLELARTAEDAAVHMLKSSIDELSLKRSTSKPGIATDAQSILPCGNSESNPETKSRSMHNEENRNPDTTRDIVVYGDDSYASKLAVGPVPISTDTAPMDYIRLLQEGMQAVLYSDSADGHGDNEGIPLSYVSSEAMYDTNQQLAETRNRLKKQESRLLALHKSVTGNVGEG